MAIEKVVKISVDQVQAAGGLEKFTESLNKSEKSTQSLRTELKNLKQQLAELPEGTAEYEKVAKKAGEVSDKIGDISTRIKNLGSDTKNIDAVVQGAQTLSGAFTVATSATQLFGVENEDLQKSMAKVEAAIGLTVGIQSIANALQKESALYIGLSNLATKVQIGLQVVYATVVGTTTGALKALRVALVSTGVGALVVGLGLLISKLQSSADATEDQAEAQARLNEELEKSNKYFNDELKGIESVTNVRKLRAQIAGKTEKELQQIEKEAHDERLKAIDDEQKRLLKQLEDKDNSVETSKKINDALAKNQEAFINELNSYEAKGLEKSLEISNKKREAEVKANEEAKRIREQNAKDLKEFNDSVKKGQNDLQIATNEAEFRQRELSIENKQRQIDEMASLGEQNTKNEEAASEARIAIAKDEAEKKAEFEKNKDQVIADSKQDLTNIVSGLEETGLAKTKAGQTVAKAIALTQIGIDSAVALSKASTLANAEGVAAQLAFPTVPGAGTAARIISYASTALSVFGNLAKAKALLSSSGGGSTGISSGGRTGTGNGVNAPSFNIVGQNSNNQLAQSIANKQSQPVEAYVVSGKVSSAQSLDRNRIETATFN